MRKMHLRNTPLYNMKIAFLPFKCNSLSRFLPGACRPRSQSILAALCKGYSAICTGWVLKIWEDSVSLTGPRIKKNVCYIFSYLIKNIKQPQTLQSTLKPTNLSLNYRLSLLQSKWGLTAHTQGSGERQYFSRENKNDESVVPTAVLALKYVTPCPC